MKHRGFALLAVLWVITGLSALALAATLVAREAVATARNRIELTRAAWLAEGCAERLRGAIDALLAGGVSWEALTNRSHIARLEAPGCTAHLDPAGATINLNDASMERLVSGLRAQGVPTGRADSIAQAILDWRDPDEVQRPLGAEAAWYLEHHRPPPRNGPFADRAELMLVRGIADLGLAGSIFGVEAGRTPINLAPLPVVASLPGIGPEIVSRIREARDMGKMVPDLARLSERTSRAARDSMLARFGELAEMATVEPDAWILTTTARSGMPPVAATLELRLERAGNRAAVVRRRTW
jgi:general secretion pathway protein K